MAQRHPLRASRDSRQASPPLPHLGHPRKCFGSMYCIRQRPGVELSSVSSPLEEKHSTHVSLSPEAIPPDKRHFGVTIPRQDVTYSGRRFGLDPRHVLPRGHSKPGQGKLRSHLAGDSSARYPRSYGTTPRSVTVEQGPRRVLVTSTLHITPRDVFSTASCQGSSSSHTGGGHTRARVERPSVNFVAASHISRH